MRRRPYVKVVKQKPKEKHKFTAEQIEKFKKACCWCDTKS